MGVLSGEGSPEMSMEHAVALGVINERLRGLTETVSNIDRRMNETSVKDEGRREQMMVELLSIKTLINKISHINEELERDVETVKEDVVILSNRVSKLKEDFYSHASASTDPQDYVLRQSGGLFLKCLSWIIAAIMGAVGLGLYRFWQGL